MRLPNFLRSESTLFTAAVAAVALALGASLMRPHAGHSTPDTTPSRVATIDLEKIYNSIERYTEILNGLKKLNEELDQKINAQQSVVKDLEAELDSFKAGSDAQAAAVQKLQIAVGEFRAIQQFSNAKLEMERARALRDTYLAIKDAARRFAERDGLDYILLDDSLPEMDPANAAKTMQQISARRFIFATPKADVTEKLIAFMNEEWKAAKGG